MTAPSGGQRTDGLGTRLERALRKKPVQLHPDTTIGRYRLIESLANTGGCELYRGHDPIIDREVAIRVVAGLPSATQQQFLQETRATARVSHPGALQVFDAGTWGHKPYVVTEFVGTRTLADQKVTEDEAIACLQHVALACHAAHELHVFHGDLQPGNVFLREGDVLRPVVGPFGIAAWQFQTSDDVRVAMASAYSSPESIRRGTVNRQTDVYALGATLFALLTGKPPFSASAELQLLQAILTQSVDWSLCKQTNSALRTTLQRALAKAPTERFPTAEAFAQALGPLRKEAVVRVAEQERSSQSEEPPEALTDLENYRLIRFLGRGGMGCVWEAMDLRFQRRVALKHVLLPKQASPASAARFQREARAAARLSSPHVVKVFDLFETPNGPCIAMELVPGCTLAERIADAGPLDPAAAVRLCVSITLALEEAHRNSILHRDLKPDNVLLADDGRVLLGDFGLARLQDDPSRLTRSDQFLGTPAYVSPEMVAGGPQDVWTDVYGVGAILYAALTGVPPFCGQGLLGVLDHVLNTTPTPPSSLRAGLWPALDRICLTCLRKSPTGRYVSVRKLREDLLTCLKEPVTARTRPRFLWAFPAILGLLGVFVVLGGRKGVKPEGPASKAPTDNRAPPPAQKSRPPLWEPFDCQSTPRRLPFRHRTQTSISQVTRFQRPLPNRSRVRFPSPTAPVLRLLSPCIPVEREGVSLPPQLALPKLTSEGGLRTDRVRSTCTLGSERSP